MKNEILDEIVQDKLHSLLEKGERIIWEGGPSTRPNIQVAFWTPGSSVSTKLLDTFVLFVFLAFVIVFGSLLMKFIGDWDFKNMISSPNFYIFVVATSLILGIPFFSNHKRRKTKYIITNQRILFQLWKDEKILGQDFSLGHAEYYSIPFSEINNIYIIDEKANEGTILLAVKNPKEIPFDSYNFKNNERRDLPTLEMIEDVNKVGEYIKLGIQGKL